MKKKKTKQKNNRLNLRAKKNKLLPKLPPCLNVTAISLKAFLYLKLTSLQTQFNQERLKKRNSHKSKEGHVTKETVMLHQWGSITG